MKTEITELHGLEDSFKLFVCVSWMFHCLALGAMEAIHRPHRAWANADAHMYGVGDSLQRLSWKKQPEPIQRTFQGVCVGPIWNWWNAKDWWSLFGFYTSPVKYKRVPGGYAWIQMEAAGSVKDGNHSKEPLLEPFTAEGEILFVSRAKWRM